MNHRFIGLPVYCLVISSCFVCLSVAGETVDSVVLEQLRTSAITDWRAMERKFHSFDVLFRFTTTVVSKGRANPVQTLTYRMAYDATRKVSLLRMQNDKTPGMMQHSVANSRYDFRVLAPEMTKRGTLNQLTMVDSSSVNPDREGGVPTWNARRCHLMSACRLSCLPLGELLNLNEFEPIEASAFDDQGLPRIRFSAKYKGEQGWVRRKGGVYSIILDPSHHYRLLSWTIDVPNLRHETFNIAYHNRDDVHTPKEIVYQVDVAGDFSEQKWTFDLPKPCTIPDEEFYLPHYGISEAVLETLNPNPWPRWLLIGFGVLTIAIGAWLVRGRRQQDA